MQTRASVRSIHRPLVGCALALLPFFHCPSASAQESPVTWEAPPSCPKPAALDDFALAETGVLSASVSIRDAGSEWHADLRTLQEGRRGQRHLVAASCEELSRAVEVVLSLLASERNENADDASAANPASPEDTSVVTSEATASPSVYTERTVAPAPFDSAPAPAIADAWTTETFGRLAASLGWVEGSTLGVGAQLAATHYETAWGGELALQGQAPWTSREAENGASIDMQFYEVVALGCHRWASAALLSACAGPRLELLRARASDVNSPESDFAFLPGVVVGFRVRGSAAARVSWMIGADAHVRLRAARFNVEPEGHVLTLSPFGARFLMGPDVRF